MKSPIVAAAIVATTLTTGAAMAAVSDGLSNGTAPAVSRQSVADVRVQGESERRYFVVLGSFKRRGTAQERCSMFGDGYVISTNDYPNFRNGYWACVIGPLSRGDADDQMWASREAVPDAYVKAGW